MSATGQPVDLEGGGKLSGRAGRWTIGTLAIRQDEFENVEQTDLFVGRVAANVLEESSVGFILTDGDPLSNVDNSLAGVDFRYQNTRLPNGRTLESEAWFQQSSTEGREGDDGAWGVRVWSPNTAKFKGGVGIKEVEANFNPALGYINRRNIRDYTGELGYTYRPLESGLRSLYTGANVQHIEYLDGGLQSEVAQLRAELENQTTDKLTFRLQNEKEGVREPFAIFPGIVIAPGDYSFAQTRVGISTGPHRQFVTTASYATGDFYDGKLDNVATQVEWIPRPRFRGLLSYDYNDVELPQGDFIVRLARVGIDVIMSAKLSWVNIIQYDNLSRTTGVNSRVHWIPEAGRELFVVLNHNLEDFDADSHFQSDTADLTINIGTRFGTDRRVVVGVAAAGTHPAFQFAEQRRAEAPARKTAVVCASVGQLHEAAVAAGFRAAGQRQCRGLVRQKALPFERVRCLARSAAPTNFHGCKAICRARCARRARLRPGRGATTAKGQRCHEAHRDQDSDQNHAATVGLVLF